MKNGDHTVYLNSNSYIEFPVKSGVSSPVHAMFEEEGVIGIENENGVPYEFSLEQNYPNPFNPNTVINYSLAAAEKVQITVYDLLGKEIKTLVNEVKGPGSYQVTFSASDISSGVYFYKITAGSFLDIKKMVVVK